MRYATSKGTLMDPAMYIFINEGLKMSPGKVAAQAAHAGVEAYRLSYEQSKSSETYNRLLDKWFVGLHYKKLVLRARDSEHMLTIDRYLQDRGFPTALIVDEGLTEIDAHSPTALGVPVVDKDDPHTAATFSTFELWRAPRPREEVKLPLHKELQNAVTARLPSRAPRGTRA
jgi:peptidyl-tRNA hydrolase